METEDGTMAKLTKANEELYRVILKAMHALIYAHDTGTRKAYDEALQDLKTLLTNK